jgi:tight adherence protein B
MLMTLACFAAVASAMMATGLVIHDVAAHRRRLKQTGDPLDEPALPKPPLPKNRIDRAFLQLIELSGTALDVPTALALVGGLAVIGCAVPLVLLESVAFAVGGTTVPVIVPLLWWSAWAIVRRRQMLAQLPDAMELMADAVRSGRDLQHAAELVAKQAGAPLDCEFNYCASQLRLGHAPVAVLDNMVRRVPFPEFRVFAAAVLVHRQTGGNLATLIERLSKVARDRQQFRGHLKAVSAGSQLSVYGVVIGSTLAVGLLSWMQPQYLEMFLTHPWGIPLLTTSGLLQLVGLLWVWRVMRVEY